MRLNEWPDLPPMQDKDDFVVGKLQDMLEKQGFDYIIENLNKFQDSDHNEIALKLIDAGMGKSVANNLEKFSDIDDKLIAQKIIEAGSGDSVVNNIEKFSISNYNEIALKVIKVGRIGNLAENLEKFSCLNKQVAMELIEFWGGYCVARNLEKFVNLDEEVALKLIEVREGDFVANNLEKFSGLDHKEIAIKLIEIGAGESIANNLEKFSGLDHKEIALKIIETGGGESVAEKLEKFSGLDKEVALKLIDSDLPGSVAYHLDKFSELDREVALKLIETRQGICVAHNLEKFSGLDYKEIAMKLIENHDGRSVVWDLEKFSGLDHKEIALKLIGSGDASSVVGNLEKFSELDKEIVLKLIDAGKGLSVVSNLEKFSGLDKEVALKLIEDARGGDVAWYLEEFSGLDKEVALKLIEAGEGAAVVNYLEKFLGIDYEEIALKIIETGQGGSIAINLEKFLGIDQKEIAEKLIEGGSGVDVINNLDKFSGLDYSKIALKLIEAGNGSQVVDNLFRFQQSLNKEIAYKLLEFGISFEEDRESFNFSPEDEKEIAQYLEQCSANYLRNDEGVLIKDTLIKGGKLGEEDYKELVDKLKKSNTQWKDRDNVLFPFTVGAEKFGYRKMFKFINRADVSRHDQLYSFDKIIKMYMESGLKSDEFYNNILDQVKKDESRYENIGSSYHKLNILADTMGSNIDDLLESIKENSQLLESFDSIPDLDKKNAFSSWKNLKKFSDLSKILEQKDLLASLNDLKKEGKKELYSYVKKLMFHPNIDTQKVMKFWKNPEEFLEIEEVHGAEAHELKKPSNYINIPNLDLTAEELRDALVEGSLDKIQDFQALEIEYELSPKTELDILNIVELTSYALGKRSEGIKGKAQSPNELFSVLNNIFKKNGLNVTDFLKLNNQEEINIYLNNNSELEKDIREELFREKLGLKRKEGAPQIFRAKINKKSDPDGVIAGNDTVNCMPFGSGKNNVYTFNPGCALFTLQRRVDDGVWRTVAESVLTKDKDIKKNIAEVLEQVNGVGSKLVDIVDSGVLRKQPSIITCDNIEVTPTFASEESDKIIETIYRDFFKEYVNRYQVGESLDNSKVIIGKGYNDSLNSLPGINNTFIPGAPLGYSDNLGKTALSLDLSGVSLYNVKGRVITENKVERKKGGIELPKGIEELTYRDTLAVSYLEGKAYHDNESLMEYMHNMENGLIAKDINNSSKNRENLSLKYTGDDKSIHGYLIAYEGIKDGESMIYVQDLASDSSIRAGGSLIKGLLEKYKVNYLDKENPIPIYAQFREQTSFKLLNKQLDAFSKELGRKLVMDEIGEYQSGNDTMHEVMIRVE